MASATLTGLLPRFPSGTLITAYPRFGYTSGSPSGAGVGTATVTSSGSATFSGLTPARSYVGHAVVSSDDRVVFFSADATVSEIDTDDLDALEGRIETFEEDGALKPATSDRVLFVSKSGGVANDGLSWGSAMLTIGDALAALGTAPGTVYVGVGEFVESVVIDQEGQYVKGTSRRFAAGTRIKAPNDAADIVSVTAIQSGVSNVHLIGSSTSWNGKALALDGAFYGEFRNIIIRNGNDTASVSTGGTALYVTHTEGALFENIQIAECGVGVHADSEATECVFTQISTSNCYQDLVFDAADESGGGNVFTRFKSVECKSGTPNAVDIAGGGSNVFIMADWDESGQGNPNKIRIASDNNVFIGGVGAPQSNWTVESDHNSFYDFRVLGNFTVSGNGNRIISPRLNTGGTGLTISGDNNTLENPKLEAGAIAVNGTGNVVENQLGAAIGGTGYTTRIAPPIANLRRPLHLARYYGNSFGTFVGASSASLLNGRMSSIYVGERATWDQLACEVTTLDASGSIRLTLYELNPRTLMPTTLIADGGLVSGTSTGVKTASISGSTTSAWVGVFVAIEGNAGSLQLRALFCSNGEHGPWGFSSGSLNARAANALSQTVVAGTALAVGSFVAPSGGSNITTNDYGGMARRSA